MALTEQRTLAEVTLVIASNTIHVRWDDNILRDGEVILRVPHRKAYSKEQKQEFLDEVENAGVYVPIVGW